MSCPVATGPCITSADGACVAPKTLASLPQLSNLLIQGASDHFVVTWDTSTSYPDYTINMLIRPSIGGAVMNRQITARDNGTLTSHTGLVEGDFYEVWLRVETPTLHDNWVKYTVLIDSNWTSNSEIVEHLGEIVMHGSDVVLIG